VKSVEVDDTFHVIDVTLKRDSCPQRNRYIRRRVCVPLVDDFFLPDHVLVSHGRNAFSCVPCHRRDRQWRVELVFCRGTYLVAVAVIFYVSGRVLMEKK
jgi:hypothetical protein